MRGHFLRQCRLNVLPFGRTLLICPFLTSVLDKAPVIDSTEDSAAVCTLPDLTTHCSRENSAFVQRTQHPARFDVACSALSAMWSPEARGSVRCIQLILRVMRSVRSHSTHPGRIRAAGSPDPKQEFAPFPPFRAWAHDSLIACQKWSEIYLFRIAPLTMFESTPGDSSVCTRI